MWDLKLALHSPIKKKYKDFFSEGPFSLRKKKKREGDTQGTLISAFVSQMGDGI